ncbi:hypothetical protein ACSGD5_15145, partial [Klebsiella pneumoniae]
MATFDAVFVGLTILDIAGRPVVAIPPRGGVAFIEQIRLNPAGTAAGAKESANKQVISSQADSLIKISRIWADFFPANTSNQPI